MKKAWLIAILFSFAVNAYAKTDNNYQVEVIIFENLTNKTEATTPEEEFVKAFGINSVKLNNVEDGNSSISSSPDLELGNIASKLNASNNYKVITHQAWQQPLYSRGYTPAIKLLGGSNLKSDYLATLGMDNYSLQGIIRISKNPYFFIDTDLFLLQEAQSSSFQTPLAPPSFHLKANRRLQQGQIHYFDHPAFGMILKITAKNT